MQDELLRSPRLGEFVFRVENKVSEFLILELQLI